MTSRSWRPSTSIDTLARRASVFASIRAFFFRSNCLEVHTPVLSSTTNSDPAVSSISLDNQGKAMYLQTSPEQHMKRLLAAGVSDCYQLGPAFRNDDPGRLHNPEFTILEWYRKGYDLTRLINETIELIQYVVHQGQEDIEAFCVPELTTYAEIWSEYLPGNPHTATKEEMLGYLSPNSFFDSQNLAVDQLRDWLFASKVQPQLQQPTIVCDFPADGCALAKIQIRTVNGQHLPVAERFELYWQGVELVNGYNELLDADEMYARYQRDQSIRAARGMPETPLQRYLYDAMRQGMPLCAGAAMGIDRLLMILLGKRRIDEVIAFPFDIV